jgi:predicted amidohydrolase
MADIRVASVQFENAVGDKKINLQRIEALTARAVSEGVEIVAFHECSISSYTFAQRLSWEELNEVAEIVPDGPSCQGLIQIAKQHDVAVLAGLFERDTNGHLYNTYVCATKDGIVAKFRKIHPFINPNLSPGTEYVVFDLFGWKCGILICYDNNVIENVRATALLGAEIIFMPHVTMCTPSSRPGAGFVDPKLWEHRLTDPTSLRAEFDGLKGRQWLMKWLPARAYDNGVYVVFSNPIGMDDDQLKNGCSMILDPFGDVLSECRNLGDDMAMAVLTKTKLSAAGGSRYRKARKPDLYREVLGQENDSQQKVSWIGSEV